MIGKDCVLDHVAIAVKDLDKSQKIWEDMGLSFSTEREVVESQGVTTAFAQMDENAHLELLCPYGENGPIHKFLEKKGEGIHHLCFKVKDVVAKCDELREKGYTLLNEQPINGANNCLVNFIHPKSTGGVLVEVSQKKA
ncbi:methylmalonyl-CoA epimerase [Halobacteriovorax marinus]|uniref:methylmalonyl-CoA epimerase n=1 Tax=Halobacteriovorax marinus TaxID=97084 RepID=UPI000BC2F566|nr:methylmalonyl-CoA epimerase [Halobacteriovorax marinus]ATH07527.1 methylmalonyl-CoA epimerase [Halobacteriovorax marinus]